MSRWFLYVGLAVVALLLAAGENAQAQRNVLPGARPGARPRLGSPPPPSPVERRMAGLPPQWVEQLQELSPGEQERFLNNNERFRSLPLQRQTQIRRRLRAWNNLPLAQRQALLERQQIWEQLAPDQRRQVRETLLPRWQSLPARRRQIILSKLRELRALDSSRREATLSDESFFQDLNPDERQMLRDLSSLGVVDGVG